MKKRIKILRKVKANMLRIRIHRFLEPFSAFFLTMAYISKLSKWVKQTRDQEYNDFYVKNHDYSRRYELYKHIIHAEDLKSIYYLEFGVAGGKSFQWWVNNIIDKDSRFTGFDTFTGLPEDWGFYRKGDMSANNLFPDVNNDQRCSFEKGIFQETLPSFLKDFDSDLRKVVHMDADIYSSTLFALTMLGPYLKKDDIIIFDEFNVPMHEFKAFSEFTSSYYIKVKLIGAVNNYYQAAFKVEENKSYRKP